MPLALLLWLPFKNKIASLESKSRQVIADGEEDKVFINNEDGIWFGGINETKTGCILAAQQADRSSSSYNKHTARRDIGSSQPTSLSPNLQPLPLPLPPLTQIPRTYQSARIDRLLDLFEDHE